MKKQWNIPTLEVLDVKKTYTQNPDIICWINPRWCQPPVKS